MKTTRYILAALLLIGATSIAAQESAEVTVTSTETQEKEKVEATIGADFVSQYIWRGQDLGNITPNNASDPYHEFEHKSFNYTNLEEQYGVPEKESSSSK